jgi:hypothetical protein
MKTAPINRPAIRILLVFLLVEAFLFTWAWGVRRLVPNYYPAGFKELYQGVAPEKNPWLEPWQRWDTLHYQAIAERGYTAYEMAYFPLYPFLMGRLAPIFRGNTLMSGLFISSVSFFGCLLLIYKLSYLEFEEEAISMRTVVYMAVYPTAFFLAATYNESLFMLEVLLCFYFIKKKSWLIAGIFAGFAALTRVPGVFLSLPIGYAVLQAWNKGERTGWVALGAMGLELSGYYIYQWIGMGQLPTATITAQNLRGGYLTFPFLNILETIRRISIGQIVVENSLELFFTLAFIVFTVLIWKKLPRLYGLYAASLMLFFLARMGSPQPLISMVRYTMEIFPVFLLFATWGAKPIVHRLIFYLSWLGLLFFTAQFAIWGWVG